MVGSRPGNELAQAILARLRRPHNRPRLHGMVCPGAWFGIPQEEWEAMAAPR
jgi:hypothetical protein